MSRPRHLSQEIEKAVQYAEALGWRVVLASGHAWGRLYCPHAARDGCKVLVWSTPRVPENHARHIRREVDQCPHAVPEAEELEKDESDED